MLHIDFPVDTQVTLLLSSNHC